MAALLRHELLTQEFNGFATEAGTRRENNIKLKANHGAGSQHGVSGPWACFQDQE